LYGRELSRDADAKLREVRLTAFKMLRSFIHRYNISDGQAATLENQLLATVTLSDVEAFAEDLDAYEEGYCGQESIDCDTSNNTEILRISLRKLLFPQLRDLIDGRTGAVLTAGEQFHSTITSPPYMTRRVRSGRTVEQIEIPFSVLLNALENGAQGPEWVIDPLTCNHRMTGVQVNNPFASGNMALNVQGQNLGTPGDSPQVIRYEVARGATDYLRTCSPEVVTGEVGDVSTVEYPIKTHIVGYAPQSLEEQQDAPPSFVTRAAALQACINAPETDGEIGTNANCWRYFARGRSLSALDWKLIITMYADDAATDSAWVLGEGIRDPDTRPVIEDLVFYFRYNARPMAE